MLRLREQMFTILSIIELMLKLFYRPIIKIISMKFVLKYNVEN